MKIKIVFVLFVLAVAAYGIFEKPMASPPRIKAETSVQKTALEQIASNSTSRPWVVKTWQELPDRFVFSLEPPSEIQDRGWEITVFKTHKYAEDFRLITDVAIKFFFFPNADPDHPSEYGSHLIPEHSQGADDLKNLQLGMQN